MGGRQALAAKVAADHAAPGIPNEVPSLLLKRFDDPDETGVNIRKLLLQDLNCRW